LERIPLILVFTTKKPEKVVNELTRTYCEHQKLWLYKKEKLFIKCVAK
jgi:hypothetical protein